MCNGRLQKLRTSLGFDGLLTVDLVGRSGGLALFWKDKHSVVLQSYSRRHICVTIQNLGTSPPWKFTGFYGHLDRTQQDESWKLLRYLKRLQPLTWLVLGDFNDIVDNLEKVGGNPRTEHQLKGFREAIKECNLGGLGE